MFIPTYEIIFSKRPAYIIAAVLILFVYIVVADSKTSVQLIASAGTLVLLLMLFLALSRLKLTIDNNGITQQLFFQKQKELRWEQIIATALVWHYHGHGATLNWEFTVSSGKKFVIVPTFYSRKDLKLIAEVLCEKCVAASIDDKILKMADGKFPWYIF